MRKAQTLLTLFIILLCSANSVHAQDDWQMWNKIGFKKKLNDKIDFKHYVEFKTKDDISTLINVDTAQGFNFHLHKHIDIGMYYMFNQENKGDRWIHEHRARSEMTFKTKLGDFKVSDRNRYEFRNVDGTTKDRYRNQVKISRSATIFNQEITPYVSQEIFYDLTKEMYNKNRVVIGFVKKISKKVSADIYFMIENDKTGDNWKGTNIIGTALNVTF